MQTHQCSGQGCVVVGGMPELELPTNISPRVGRIFELSLLHLPPRGRSTPETEQILAAAIEQSYGAGTRRVFVPVQQGIADSFFGAVKSADDVRLAHIVADHNIGQEVVEATKVALRLGMALYPLWPNIDLQPRPVSGSQGRSYVHHEMDALISKLSAVSRDEHFTEESPKENVLVLHYKQPFFNDVFPSSLCRVLRHCFPDVRVSKCEWFTMEGPENEHGEGSALNDI